MHYLNCKTAALMAWLTGASFSLPIRAQTPNPNALTAPAGSQAYPSGRTKPRIKAASSETCVAAFRGNAPHRGREAGSFRRLGAKCDPSERGLNRAPACRCLFSLGPRKYISSIRTTISRDDPEARCLPPGVPRMTTTPYPFRIVQTPGLTMIVYEGGAHVWRQIFTDGRAHSDDPNPSWLGESIGQWEGDTFVIDTIGFNGKTWLDEAGLPTTESLHVIERFRRPDFGHLEIENTVDDPKAYTKPWSFTTHPVMLKGELMEYICQENNRDVEHLVGK